MSITISFQDALRAASEAGEDMDANNCEETRDAFHAAWLNVRRTIHRDFPTHYGDPDTDVDEWTRTLADAMLQA